MAAVTEGGWRQKISGMEAFVSALGARHGRSPECKHRANEPGEKGLPRGGGGDLNCGLQEPGSEGKKTGLEEACR